MFLKLAPFKNKAVETTFCYQFLFVCFFFGMIQHKRKLLQVWLYLFLLQFYVFHTIFK